MQISFRDPDGLVFRSGGRILRCVFPHAADDLRAFLSSAVASTAMAEGILACTTVLNGAASFEVPPAVREKVADGAVVLEHKPIPFPNYPYEWAPEMLHRAAAVTLRLARAAVSAGFGLKDATPYNVMFDGPKPVFLDLLSFARRDPLDALWRPYGQFVRTFVYPLLACRYFGLHLDELLLVHRDGLEPERVLRLCSPWRRLLPPFLGAVTVPALLSRGDDADKPDRFRARRARDPDEANYLLNRLFTRANRLLGDTPTPARKSAAARYMDSGHMYATAEFAEKERVVSEALKRIRAESVLDIGCNTGHFSLLAARHGARVVAVDHDPDAVGLLWKRATEDNLDILPLVVDIARPPGACGWENDEFPSFLERARGKFGCVLMLALIHHLLVNERAPLDRILGLASALTTGFAIIEYVDPADPQFQRIARGRDVLHRDLTRDSFEGETREFFDIVDSHNVTPTRRIYVLAKKRG